MYTDLEHTLNQLTQPRSILDSLNYVIKRVKNALYGFGGVPLFLVYSKNVCGQKCNAPHPQRNGDV